MLFPAAALALILPVFLPVAVAVVAGDAIAGEASAGTLRYLLVRPVSRTRLVMAKVIMAVAFIVLAIFIVAIVSLIAGGALFGIKPLTSLSGTGLSTARRSGDDADDRLHRLVDARPGRASPCSPRPAPTRRWPPRSARSRPS